MADFPSTDFSPDESDESDEADGLQRPSLLVVDDDEAVREALEFLLTHAGYDVAQAEHGARALELLVAGPPPDLILLDLMMPVMTGWDLWERLQQSPALARIPVIIFTATGLGPGSVGAATVLSKTADTRTLLETVARLLRAD